MRTSDEAPQTVGHALAHALVLLVAALAEPAPLALLVDDLHWCDPQSLRFLLYLQQRLDRLPVALVAATRPSALSAQRELLGRIATGPHTGTLRLEALRAASVAALVRAQTSAQASDAFCRTCWELAAGNPFYLRELLVELRSRRVDQSAVREHELARTGPVSVARSVLLRLGGLPAGGAQALAEAVAILGDRVALRHAGALAGLDAAQAAAAADTLAAAELLTPGEPLSFVHPLVRTAIYDDIPAARRAHAHAHAARLLAAEAGHPEQIAFHLLHTSPAADPSTAQRLRAAGADALRRGAPAPAARYLRRALEEPPAAAERPGLLVELAAAETAAGEASAGKRLEAALELVDDARRRAEILLALGWAHHHAGRFADAAQAFERGLAELGSDDAELAAMLQGGYCAAGTLDSAHAADAHARARAIEAELTHPRSGAERELLAHVLLGHTFAGHPHHEVIALAERIWADGRALEEQSAAAQTVWNVIGALSWADAYGQAERAIEVVLADARRRGSALAYAQASYARAWPRYWTARLDDATADAEAAIDVWRGGMEMYLPAAVYWLVLCLLERDRHDEAQAALELAAPFDGWAGTAFEVFLLGARGRVAAHRGDHREALEHHLACGRLAVERLHAVNPTLMPWRSQAALAAARVGEDEHARALAAEEVELARRFGAPRALGAALRAAGLIEGSIDLLGQAVDVLQGNGAVLERAYALVDLGAAVRRAGQRAAARPNLRDGLRLAEDAGATVLARHAEIELRATGTRASRRAPLVGPLALTPSEQRIAALAAAGRSNREIADGLFITVKGVEWHLHQTYRKLQIQNRGQLARALARPPAPPP